MPEPTPKPKKKGKATFQRGHPTALGPANTGDPSVDEVLEMDTHAIAELTEAKPAPKKRVPHAFIPTDEHRRRVRDLVLCQMKRDRIASLLGISLATLERHFSHELNHALDAINSKVAFTMARLAMEGNVRAADFWLRTQAGFKNARDEADQSVNTSQIIVVGGLPD